MTKTLEEIKAELNGKGRYDFIIFPNGGRECIARIAAEPVVAEAEYLPVIKEFTANNPMDKPAKFTAIYDAENVEIGEWQGEIAWPEERENI